MAKLNSAGASASANKIGFYATCIGYFMTILDVTVVNVALKDMQSQLGASVIGIQWVIIAYTLVFASLLLSTGILGEIFSNRRVYLSGLICFTSASLLCGFAPNLLFLQVARGVQGVGAALMVPTSLALIAELFPDKDERSRAMGTWGAVASIGAGSGPIIGGLLVNMLGWRSIFLINVPIGIIGLILTIRYIQPGRPRPGTKLDIPGQMASIIGLGALTLACLRAKNWGFLSMNSLITIGTGVLSLIAFVWIEMRSAAPMLPLKFFKNKSFSTGNIVGFLLNFAFYGQFFIISLYFQQVRHLSPLLTGISLLPEMAIMIVAAMLSGRINSRTGPKLPMAIGLGIGALGFLLQVLVSAQTHYILLAGMLLATGFGMALTMPAMTSCVMGSAPENKASTASGVLNACRQAGSSFGVAIIGSLVAGAAFMPGMHLGVLISCAAFFASLIITLVFIKRKTSN
jgi:MFS transporter, DHA2 family, methylenomycin A resistance protein